jgi:hypothetical protein
MEAAMQHGKGLGTRTSQADRLHRPATDARAVAGQVVEVS